MITISLLPKQSTELTWVKFLTIDFFNIDKRNQLQDNESRSTYGGSYETFFLANGAMTQKEMAIIINPTFKPDIYTQLDYNKYKIQSKDLKFNRDEINER